MPVAGCRRSFQYKDFLFVSQHGAHEGSGGLIWAICPTASLGQPKIGTVTRKGDTSHIWKVANVQFLYLSTKLRFCLAAKSKLVANT